jgi:hypothetical protein
MFERSIEMNRSGQSENWMHASQFKQEGAMKETSNSEFSKSIRRTENSATGESNES